MASTMAPDLSHAATVFHALSDETRLAILSRLRGGERCVCDLTDLLDAAQSRLSFHLKVLKDAGLVTSRRDGRWMHYEMVPGALDDIGELVGAMKPSGRELRVRTANSCC
jgi:ArsR family transcriptional regulator